MCGIVGYVGKRGAVSKLVNGLERLEYRGYDSAGCGFPEANSDRLTIIKAAGKIANLKRLVGNDDYEAAAGIAHTRWATHGEVSEVNAHPITNGDQTIAVVHNGIIENYRELKAWLTGKGHQFITTTDTEVIAHLIDEVGNGDLLEQVRLACQRLVGTYGILVVSSAFPDEIVVVRNGCPLMLGIGRDENFAASDASPILEHTKQVVYLEDGQIARLTADNYEIFDLERQSVNSEVSEIEWSIEQIAKGGFPHYMLKEIHEQERSLRDTIAGRIREDRIFLGGIKDHLNDLASAPTIVLTACGTSWHAGLIGEMLLEEMAGKPAEVKYASELANLAHPSFPDGSVMIAISQSGETKDTDLAVQRMIRHGMKTYGICNVVGSTIARRVNAGVYIHAGPEIGVASTKAFTAQIMALLMMSFSLGQSNGFIAKNFRPDWPKKFLKRLMEIPRQIETILSRSQEIEELARRFYKKDHVLFLGRGLNLPVALEGALKLKEISYIHAEGYPAAEMKHGPIALISKDMPVVVTVPRNDNLYPKICTNIEEVKSRGGVVIAIATEGDEDIKELVDHVLYVPATSYFLSPFLMVVPLQLLAYYCAVLRGCNVDQPRNLAKSVTVE